MTGDVTYDKRERPITSVLNLFIVELAAVVYTVVEHKILLLYYDGKVSDKGVKLHCE